MIKPTMLVTWGVHIDYSWFRYILHKNYHLFKNIIICFTNLNQVENYSSIIKLHLPFAQTIKPFNREPDWRNDTVKSMLSVLTDDTHLLFIEQDFLFNRAYFLKRIFDTNEDFIYYNEGERTHPAFCLIKREIVDKTSCDFAAHPDDLGLDHFGKFFQEAKIHAKGKEIRELGFEEKKDFYHLGGLTQNYACYFNNQPLVRPQEFLAYNYQCMLLPHPITRFYKTEMEIAEKYGLGDSGSFLNTFFPDYESPVD